ncbi:unnamed protein product [Thelazia callipaeda]|uniref:E3 UFM1-protein ligase 1 homolog n=1 Tax=Thelazia callipaeda TaxID=103827 RepID=A0A0N5D6B1_THECL|nr:unnamed protein product [Thelazia callipaeda]
MSATWADIQRLAADFQRLQLTSESKKLSENNCIEVISMLVSSGDLDIVFTTDGKEYVTRDHLLTEIKNECFGQGRGRVSLSDLAHTLNVNYEHIEHIVPLILKQSSSFVFYNAELISKDYVSALCNSLNERLLITGVVSISKLAKEWDLPTEMLNDLILHEIGSKVEATFEADALYTRSYLCGQRNVIKAMLCGVTKVIPVAKMLSKLGLTSTMFWFLFDQLDAANEVPGKIIGSRTSIHSLYQPNIYSVLVKQYIRKTFLEEGILQCSMFKKFLITDPKAYLKDVLEESEYLKIVHFPSAVISSNVWDEIEAAINEELNRESIANVQKFLPDVIQNDADFEQAMALLIKSNKECFPVYGTSYIYNKQFLSNAITALDDFISTRAKELTLMSGKQQIGRKQEKWKRFIELSVRLSEEELMKEIQKFVEGPRELVENIIDKIQAQANASLRARIDSLLHTTRTISAQDQKRSHSDLQATLSNLYNNICIFEDGAAAFEDTVKANLKLYLLRTLCTHFANNVLSYLSRTEDVDTLSTKARDETIASIENPECRMATEKLFAALSAKDLGLFHDAVFGVCSSAVCAVMIKIPDKKLRIDLINSYEKELGDQLRDCTDPASGLLLALLILITRNEKIAVHASGKFVSHLIEKVEKHPGTDIELIGLLISFQKMVITNIQSKGETNLTARLDEKLLALKAAVNGFEYIENPIIVEGDF